MADGIDFALRWSRFLHVRDARFLLYTNTNPTTTAALVVCLVMTIISDGSRDEPGEQQFEKLGTIIRSRREHAVV